MLSKTKNSRAHKTIEVYDPDEEGHDSSNACSSASIDNQNDFMDEGEHQDIIETNLEESKVDELLDQDAKEELSLIIEISEAFDNEQEEIIEDKTSLQIKQTNTAIRSNKPVSDQKIDWRVISSDGRFQTSPGLSESVKFDYMPVELKASPINIPEEIASNMTPYQAFSLFFPDEIWEALAFQTNLYADQERTRLREQGSLTEGSRINRWKEVSSAQIKKYIGIILWNGLLSNVDYKDNWSTETLFETNHSKYLSLNKFLLLHRFFHINDNAQKNNDILHKIRPLIESCNKLWSKYFSVGLYMTLDETMIKFRGRLKFRQYMKDKPVKWGIKSFLLCDAISGYCYKIEIYTGKDSSFVNSEGNSYTESIVMKMTEGCENKWRTLYLDNFYTTIKVINALYKKKISCIGTIRKNRLHEMVELQEPKTGGDSEHYIKYPQNNIILTLWKDSQVVQIINTVKLPKILKVKKTWSDKEKTYTKPDVIEDYNTKCRGVDHCNQMTTQFRYPHGSRKWYKPIVYHLIHISIYNAYLIYKNIKGSSKTYKTFYSEIILALLGESQKKAKSRHYPDFIDENKHPKPKLRCRKCSALTVWYCPGCTIGGSKFAVCVPNCYREQHDK